MNVIFRFSKSRTKTGDSIHRQFQAKRVFVQQLDNSLISENDAFQLAMTSLSFYPRKKTWFHLEPGAVDECVTLIIYIRCYDSHKQIAPKYDHIVNCWQYIVGAVTTFIYGLLLHQITSLRLQWTLSMYSGRSKGKNETFHIYSNIASGNALDPCVSVFFQTKSSKLIYEKLSRVITTIRVYAS